MSLEKSSSAKAETRFEPRSPVSRVEPSRSFLCSLAKPWSMAEYFLPVSSGLDSSLPFMMLNLSWKAALDHLGTLSFLSESGACVLTISFSSMFLMFQSSLSILPMARFNSLGFLDSLYLETCRCDRPEAYCSMILYRSSSLIDFRLIDECFFLS